MMPTIAIVGRPNVGKSALFNRIAGRRIAIVHDQPGVTRDRIIAPATWQGRVFNLMDTGGIGLMQGEKSLEIITQAAQDQVRLALESAHTFLFVVNAREGVVPLDREVAQRLHHSGKPVIVAINKVDTHKDLAGIEEFAALGFDRLVPISAIHNHGVDALLDEALKCTPTEPAPIEPLVPPELLDDDAAEAVPPPAAPLATLANPLKLAIVGRPNVGKSSLINALVKSPRLLVSPIPGTTRDAVDVPFEVEDQGVRQAFVLIDTAGMRKSRRVADTVEFVSVKRAEDSIERCDIVTLVLDAEQGISEQDKKIADRIVDARKACILVVNKWDLVAAPVEEARQRIADKRQDDKRARYDSPRQRTTLPEFGEWVQKNLFFLDYAPVIFLSAKTRSNLGRYLETIRFVARQLQQRIPTAVLNRTLHDAVERRQPVSKQGHRLKFFYATQIEAASPAFLLFVNRADLFTDAYRKYLATEMRRAFGFEGCPIHLIPKARPKTIESIRRKQPIAPSRPQRSARSTRPTRQSQPSRHRRTSSRRRA